MQKSRVVGNYAIPLLSFLVQEDMSPPILGSSMAEGISKCQAQQEAVSPGNPKYG